MTKESKGKLRRVLLGEISGAHGIRGAVLIRSFTAEPADIAAYGMLHDETGQRRLAITVERVTSKGVIGRVAGVSDRTEAEKLKGTKLYVTRAQLPEAPEGEFYHADLVGLVAVDTSGVILGEVVAVVNYGASDLIEIRRPGSRATELVAFTEAFIREVDLESGRVVVSMPEESADEETAAQSGDDG